MTSLVTKQEKEKAKLIQEKCQGMLNDMLREEDNKYCCDCDAKGPRWAAWNLGLFLCIRCAGIHRNLGVHISKVKSVNLDTWTPEQVVSMTSMGNSRARTIYEANLPETFRRPQTDAALETFIRAKYEQKKYISSKDFVPLVVGKVDWSKEIEETLKEKKERNKRNNNNSLVLFPKLKLENMEKNVNPIKEGNKEGKEKEDVLFDLGDVDVAKETLKSPGDMNGLTSSELLLEELNLDVGAGNVPDDKGKMTKEGILSLYATSQNFGGVQNPIVPGFQQQSNLNPFFQQQQMPFPNPTPTPTNIPEKKPNFFL